MTSSYRVVKVHSPDSAESLILNKDDVVAFERRETLWEGWLWCTKSSGETGWVPESWVRIKGDQANLQCDYISLELSVEPGVLLESILTESGWLLAVSPDGITGWVPLECVEPAEEEFA